MAIWKLTPFPTHSSDWDLSTYRGEVIVRAKDEWEARQVVTLKFTVAANRELGQRTPRNPWENAALVSCETIQDPMCQDIGPATVLSPGR